MNLVVATTARFSEVYLATTASANMALFSNLR